ncbi:MAG: T9SS type A sorting domain-containing protein [Ignavibacteriales bacterium]|nr:T9SS type A sorting domain-containing protein [Ignavibacteriales bacterium]
MPKVCSDGLGGFITAWQDVRSPGQIGIYAQRINTAGSLLWSPSGIILTTNSTSPSIVANNSNGLIAVWTDYRTPSTAGDILGQSIDGNSNLTGVSEEKVIPKEFSLFQNYPNPFNPVTTIRYQLPINSHLKLKVFDLLGIEVSTLVNENKNAGSYEVEFDGSKLPSGVYFYRLQTGSYVETKKLLLMK